jgi:hypothetical protein
MRLLSVFPSLKSKRGKTERACARDTRMRCLRVDTRVKSTARAGSVRSEQKAGFAPLGYRTASRVLLDVETQEQGLSQALP